MKKLSLSFKSVCLAINLIGASLVLGQGSLTPLGAPAPTQKSLQEIWDRIGGLETQVADLQSQNSALTNLLLSIGQTTGAIPWQLSTVDSVGSLGAQTSLAFTPGGQPAISYYEASHSRTDT